MQGRYAHNETYTNRDDEQEVGTYKPTDCLYYTAQIDSTEDPSSCGVSGVRVSH